MIIEQNTNYAYKLKYMENPTFDKVRDLAIKFMRELPKQLQDELYEALNRGIDILDSEPQLVTYLYAFGPMHQAKLNYAFKHLPEEFLEQPEINIIDYGCGQALGTMCYADYLRENGYAQKVKTITLIEPSEMCLKRAALHASVFFPDAEIKTVNKTFDELDEKVIYCDEDVPILHILANVLDILDFDLEGFTELIKSHVKSYNQFVCVGPYFNYSNKDERMDEFLSLMDGEEKYCVTFDKYEFDSEKAWTAQIICFSTGVLEEKSLSTKVTDEDVANEIEDKLGVVYSKDGKRLIRCKNHKLKIYNVRQGTITICDSAFFGCYSLQTINIPDSVSSIGDCAFTGCWSLQSITIPNAITSIRFRTFFGCKSLQKIIIPNSVSNIGAEVFRRCPSLHQITLPKSVTNIGNGVVNESAYLKVICDSTHFVFLNNMLIDKRNGMLLSCNSKESEIVIPNFVTEIGAGAFEKCISAQQIIIPDSVTKIGFSAFSECSSLQQITIPNSVTSIGDWAFYECNSLRQIIIPNSVTDIGDSAFSHCASLQHCIISNSTTRIGNQLFKGCKYLIQIKIPISIISIGDWAFDGCKLLQQIIIPNSVTYIGMGAFTGCESLLQLNIPNSITSIEDWEFEECLSLQQITIPDSVIQIGEDAFDECKSLQQIIIPIGSSNRFREMLSEELWDKLVEQ